MTMMTIKQRSYEPAKQSTKVKLSEQCNHCIQLLAHTETTFIIFGIGINADSIREALKRVNITFFFIFVFRWLTSTEVWKETGQAPI